jgi:hypothetical protein
MFKSLTFDRTPVAASETQTDCNRTVAIESLNGCPAISP